MIRMHRTDSKHPHFVALVQRLDADLKERDGDDHDYYAQFNKIDTIQHAIVVYDEDHPVSCGAIKPFGEDAMEVKRMYVLPESRGKGIAKKVLQELESWASEMKYKKCVLETGQKQPEAMSLYHKSGYQVIQNYGQYIGIENSVCFEKALENLQP